jgi:hypothetical protein
MKIILPVSAARPSLISTAPKACCQTIAIGHLTSDVNVSVSTASNAIASYKVGTIAQSDTTQSEQSRLIDDTFQFLKFALPPHPT